MSWGRTLGVLLALVFGALLSFQGSALALDDFDLPPIRYAETAPTDVIANLKKKLESGGLDLNVANEKACVRALLRELNIPESSQVLVFSKTSFQNSLIHPGNPRAIYFNRDCYLGWVPGGSFEVISTDPKLGAVFYVLDRQPAKNQLKIQQHTGDCFTCHASSRTGNRPGMMVRSVYADHNGLPIFSAGTFQTGHDSPLRERWGGWYVTGRHGNDFHMGNAFAMPVGEGGAEFDPAEGANVTSLDGYIRTARYPAPTSDIVALMVLEHQTGMHNRLIEGDYEVRRAIFRKQLLDRELGNPDTGGMGGTTGRIINNQAEKILRHLLFCEEYTLKDGGIDSAGEFQSVFEDSVPSTGRGRSLAEFQLLDRLFKYRCSYMIYSQAFDNLPAPLKAQIYRRLWDVLTGADNSEDFQHLSVSERERIRDILAETKAGLPDYWTPEG